MRKGYNRDRNAGHMYDFGDYWTPTGKRIQKKRARRQQRIINKKEVANNGNE